MMKKTEGVRLPKYKWKLGNCFHDAFLCMMKLLDEYSSEPVWKFNPRPDVAVVHGLPLGLGGDAEGKRFVHAWVELDIYRDRYCLDISGLHKIDTYYRLGKIERAVSYMPLQICRLVADTGTSGPWEPDFVKEVTKWKPTQKTRAKAKS